MRGHERKGCYRYSRRRDIPEGARALTLPPPNLPRPALRHSHISRLQELSTFRMRVALLPLREKGWDEGGGPARGPGKLAFPPHPNPSPARGEGLHSTSGCIFSRLRNVCIP
ncbi:hypothetical protein [Azospirillum doebereinerae]